MSRLRKGDTVEVLAGKDRGKRGKIMKVFPDREMALVERINLLKHFERRSQANQAGGVIERESPIALAKLAALCTQCSRPTRIGVRLSGSAKAQPTAAETPAGSVLTKERICKRCGGVLRG